MTTHVAADVIVQHANTTADNLILIGSGIAFTVIAYFIAHAVADCWDVHLAAVDRRDTIRAHETAALETWIGWLPTAAGMRIREAELKAGDYCVHPLPVSAKRARLAEFRRLHPEAVAV